MKKIFGIMFIVGGIGLLSCSGSKQNQSEKDPTDSGVEAVDAHNTRNSLDYQGTYTGIVFDDDDNLINMMIVLTEYEYELRIIPEDDLEMTMQKGEYTWDTNGSVITLEGIEAIPAKYFVAEGQLRQLDENGKQHTGENAVNYVLIKQ